MIGHHERGGKIQIVDAASAKPSKVELARRERMKREANALSPRAHFSAVASPREGRSRGGGGAVRNHDEPCGWIRARSGRAAWICPTGCRRNREARSGRRLDK